MCWTWPEPTSWQTWWPVNPDLLASLATDTGDAVASLTARWVRGELTDAEFVALVEAVVQRGQAEGVALADLGTAAALGAGGFGLMPDADAATRAAELARSITVTTDWQPTGQPARVALRQELVEELKLPGQDREYYISRRRTINTLDRAALAGRAEVLDTTQRANGQAIRRHGTPWRRAPNGDACEVCTDLTRAGPAPADVSMWNHRGCSCTQTPVATR